MSNDITPYDIQSLKEAIAKANVAAERLVRCAESISNPTYSVVMRDVRDSLEIVAVRHFQGQIIITVKNPFSVLDTRKPIAFGPGSVLELKDDPNV